MLYANRKKKVLQESSSLSLISKDIQKDFTKIYEILESLEFGLSAFVRCLFPGKGIIGSNHPSTLKLES